MTGAFIIEGDYDHTLRTFYRSTQGTSHWDRKRRSSLSNSAPCRTWSTLKETISGGERALGQRPSTAHHHDASWPSPTVANCEWRFQGYGGVVRAGDWLFVAADPQDGVQFSPVNYADIGRVNARVVLASANRADLLVQAGTTLTTSSCGLRGRRNPRGGYMRRRHDAAQGTRAERSKIPTAAGDAVHRRR